MKRPSRELNIFSLSALDLFASAMGAFILVAVILFPYYQNNAKIVQELQETKTRADVAEEHAKSAEERARSAEERAKSAQAAEQRAQAAERRAQEAERRAQEAERKAQEAEARAKAAEARTQGPMRVPGGDPSGRSLAFAKGCWRTDPFQHQPQVAPGVSQYCFDENGNGNLYFYRPQGSEVCAAPATLRRQGDIIRIDDSDSRCQVGQRDVGPWYADHLVCRPDANGIVICEGTSERAAWRVRLHRQ